MLANLTQIIAKSLQRVLKMKFRYGLLNGIVMMLFIWVKNSYIQWLHAMDEMRNKRKRAYVMIICKTDKFRGAMTTVLVHQ